MASLLACGQRRGHSLPGGAWPAQGSGQPDATLPVMAREGRSPNEGVAWRGKAHRTGGDDGIVMLGRDRQESEQWRKKRKQRTTTWGGDEAVPHISRDEIGWHLWGIFSFGYHPIPYCVHKRTLGRSGISHLARVMSPDQTLPKQKQYNTMLPT